MSKVLLGGAQQRHALQVRRVLGTFIHPGLNAGDVRHKDYCPRLQPALLLVLEEHQREQGFAPTHVDVKDEPIQLIKQGEAGKLMTPKSYSIKVWFRIKFSEMTFKRAITFRLNPIKISQLAVEECLYGFLVYHPSTKFSLKYLAATS